MECGAMKMPAKGKLQARADGYIDGLLARQCNRLFYPPFDRFAYLAGYADGEKCRPDKGLQK